MDEPNVTTSDSTALSPVVESDASPASTLAGFDGVGQIATDALATATPDPIESVITGIPDADDDLATIADEAHRTTLTGMRGQLRTLRDAVRGLKPLEIFREFGTPDAVKPRLELARLLYSPLVKDGQPVRDPATQTTYIDTRPFIGKLDEVSPGMPEQLFANLAMFTPKGGYVGQNGTQHSEPLGNGYLRYLKLDPARLDEYRNIDKLVERTGNAVTPEELANIPAEYHAAYQSIPPSIRNAWETFDEADQTRLLEDYKGRLDTAARDKQRAENDQRDQVARQQQYAQAVTAKQEQYFDSVRRERFTSLYNTLEQQVTFSTDAVQNSVMLGALCATLANLLDPAWRFIATEKVLTPLGLKLPAGFDEVLAKFDTNAADKVASEMAGDIGRSGEYGANATSAAEQLMAKIAPIALKVAVKQGATVKEKADVQAAALAAAATSRATVNGQTTAQQNGILPQGMRPDSDEATRFIAEQSGFWRPRPAA